MRKRNKNIEGYEETVIAVICATVICATAI